MWDRVEDRLALLELLVTGRLRRRARQEAAYAWLAELPWTRATGRRDELALDGARRNELLVVLDRVWPAWREVQVALVEAGLPPTPGGHDRLEDLRRRETAPALPVRVNRHTAAAVAGPGAKAALTARRRDVLGATEVVEDGLVRLRVPPGLVARRGRHALDLDAVTAVLDEVGVSDRAVRDGLTLEGEVEALLLVENLGAWRDLPRPGRWVVAHVPGWNTGMVRGLLGTLGDVPVVHFGDLDPNGVRIVRHLRASVPGLRWLVPAFGRELLETHGRPCAWPPDVDGPDLPPLVRELVVAGRWLEQERLAIDPRLLDAIVDVLRA